MTGPNRTPQGDRVRIAILHLIQGQGDAHVTSVPVRTAVYTAVPVHAPTSDPQRAQWAFPQGNVCRAVRYYSKLVPCGELLDGGVVPQCHYGSPGTILI